MNTVRHLHSNFPLRRLLCSSKTRPSQLHPISLVHYATEDRRPPLRRRYCDGDAGADGESHSNGVGEPWDRSFQLHKGRGQHLLANPRVLDAIVRKAGLRPSDTVLEIGPGTGNLTVRLLDVAANVVAVEIDERMVESLLRRASALGRSDRLAVLKGDALKAEFGEFDICVANIPYGISSPLIMKLLFGLSRPCRFRSAVLLLQKEFARRLVAMPGDSEFNRLAANLRLVANVELLMDVSKKDFIPCPKVDSSLVRIQPKAMVPPIDMDEWLAFTRTCFSKKNKTLGATFKKKKKVIELLWRYKSEGTTSRSSSEVNDYGIYDQSDDDSDDENLPKQDVDAAELSLFKEKIVGILRSGGFEAKRPSKLATDEFLNLLQLFNQDGIKFR